MPQLKFFVAGGLIIGAIGFLMFSGINNSMVYYYGVSEVLAKGPEIYDKGIRVSGNVAEGSIQRNNSLSEVSFLVREKNSDLTIPVVYQGIVPDTFKDHAEVVVEGAYSSSDKVFHATTLLAKCPSKYEKLQEEYDDSKAAESTAQNSGAAPASNN